jgi:hypothetical protein
MKEFIKRVTGRDILQPKRPKRKRNPNKVARKERTGTKVFQMVVLHGKKAKTPEIESNP